jgi:hypothetical protein
MPVDERAFLDASCHLRSYLALRRRTIIESVRLL